jgi:hypothetical protein
MTLRDGFDKQLAISAGQRGGRPHKVRQIDSGGMAGTRTWPLDGRKNSWVLTKIAQQDTENITNSRKKVTVPGYFRDNLEKRFAIVMPLYQQGWSQCH